MAKSSDPAKDKDFNEALKKLLETPPKHHADEKKGGTKTGEPKSARSAGSRKASKQEKKKRD